MATHGKAREITIENLRSCTPFQRSGFAMSAVQGAIAAHAGLGQLPTEYVDSYRKAAGDGEILYTVLSYQTPIAWVLVGGEVIIPDTRYSVTTTHHQTLCRAYLAN